MDFSVITGFVQANWIEVLAIIGAIDIVLGIITKWTPTKVDDNVYAVIHSWTSKLLGKGK